MKLYGFANFIQQHLVLCEYASISLIIIEASMWLLYKGFNCMMGIDKLRYTSVYTWFKNPVNFIRMLSYNLFVIYIIFIAVYLLFLLDSGLNPVLALLPHYTGHPTFQLLSETFRNQVARQLMLLLLYGVCMYVV